MYDEEADLYVDVAPAEPEVMRGRRVVAAVDGSEGSMAALRFALEDAARRGVPVEAVIAYRVPELWVDYDGIGSPEEQRLHDTLRSQSEDKVRTAVDEAARDLDGPLPDVEVRAALGAPADALIRESDGADLLVVGSRGHGGFHTMLLGSTSMQCAMHAACPVTVVHSPEAHSHRLRLHRERQDQRPSERRGSADASPQAQPLR